MQQMLRYLAFPISLVYALAVLLRNLLYDWGLLVSHGPGTPTVCVGNLSVGGTGKTPMVEFLVELLADHRVAVLSRGYKRRSKGFLLAGPQSTVFDLGDEPYQLHRKYPDLALAVDGDRLRGIAHLEDRVAPELILLDDAFQHRRVKPALSILLTAHDRPYVDDWYLPTGSLRDAKGEADRADLIVVTKCPMDLPAAAREALTARLRPHDGQRVLFAHLAYGDRILDGRGGGMELSALKGKRVALVTGIASPGPLLVHLESQDISFVHYGFGDHHHFSDREISPWAAYDLVLCTEKDHVRLEGRLENLYYLPVAHGFSPGDRALLEARVKALI